MNTVRLARPLHAFERRGPTRTFDVDGWKLLRDFPTLLFGDGGALKSFLALYMAGRLAQGGLRVLLADWELDGEDHSERLHRLFGDEVPTGIFYFRAERPLAKEADVLRQECLRNQIQYLIVDSVGLATDGPPDSSDQALSYFRTLRCLGVPGSLNIAHVTKNNEGADKKPFGSAYWHNLARMTWSAKGESSEPERPCVRLVNRKTNLTEVLPDLRFQFDFSDDRIVVSQLPVEIHEPEAAVADLSIRQRIIVLLKNKEPMTVQAIAEALDAKEDTVSRTIRRSGDSFVKLPGPDGTPRIGLRYWGSS